MCPTLFNKTLFNKSFFLIFFICLIFIIFLFNFTSFTYAVNGWKLIPDKKVGIYYTSTILLPTNKILISGGSNLTGLSAVNIFNPATFQWESARNMQLSRYGHTSNIVTLNDDSKRVLVVGGQGGTNNSMQKTAELYNFISSTWVFTSSSMNSEHAFHTATTISDGKVLVTGGFDKTFIATSSAEIYDPFLNSWTNVKQLPFRRAYHTAVLLNDGRVMLAGGLIRNGSSNISTNSVSFYNPFNDSWENAPSLNQAHTQHTMTLLKDGRVMVAGGETEDPNITFTDTVEIWSPVTNTWTIAAHMFHKRRGHTATMLNDGRVLVAGGYGGPIDGKTTYLNSAEIYDPNSDTWRMVESMNMARMLHSSVLTADGSVMVVGGLDVDGKVQYDEIYTPDVLGVSIGPSPSPTPTPTPSLSTTPAPFLNLPWDYNAKNDTFNDAALAINSYFDHTYPLLSAGLAEPADFLNQVTTFEGKNTTKPYSNHDGYDYGSPAGIKWGEPVLAAASGIATYASGSATGYMIKIDHENGYQTRYMHLQKDGLVTNKIGEQIVVSAGQKIGLVGNTGNCSPKINEQDQRCSHIHFNIVQDKDGNGSFDDNIPDGVTDPFGWEPVKDNDPTKKDPDPWFIYTFKLGGIDKTGNTSYYLWKNKLNSIVSAIGINGGDISLGDINFHFPGGAVTGNTSIDVHSSPVIQTQINGKNYRSVGPSITAKAHDLLGNIIENFLVNYKLTIKFLQSKLYNIDPEYLSIYSSSDGQNWNKEITNITKNQDGSYLASADLNHFSYFSVLGPLSDETAPITKTILSGVKEKDNNFRSDVIVTLSSSDDKSGVSNSFIKINENDWEQYISPITFTDEGEHIVQYYSVDEAENTEDVKTNTFFIDKTAPQVQASPERDPDKNNWYNHPFTILFNGTDSGSGIDTCDSIAYGGSDIVKGKLTGYCTDKAGNTNSADFSFMYDSTNPSILASAVSNGLDYKPNTWTNRPVTVTFSCTDETSDVDSFTQPVSLSNEIENYMVNGSCSDIAGNSNSTQFGDINIDMTAPTLFLNTNPKSLWPPNGKMMNVQVLGNSNDKHLKSTKFTIQDEYKQVEPLVTQFGQIIKLEARRNGYDLDGRTYRLRAIAEDEAGNTFEAMTDILVPHDL